MAVAVRVPPWLREELPDGPPALVAQSPQGKRRRRSVRKHIVAICAYYFGWKPTPANPENDYLQDFQLEALEAMFEGGYLVINWPTDHSKSTTGTFLFPLLSLMENPDETHIICGANLADSKRRLKALELEIETNQALVRDFPWVGKPAREQRIWTALQFNVAGRSENKPNPSVYASAIGANELKGRRGKLLMDDIEGEDARWSPTKREQMYSWLKLEAWRCYEDKRESYRPLLCLLGTPFDVDSIYFRVEAEDWKVMRRRCYLDGGLMPDVQVFDANGKPWNNPPRKYLWEKKKDKVERARRRLRKIEFSIAYLMDPTGGDDSKLSSAQLTQRMRESEFEAPQHLTFAALDPASGSTNRQADYAGIAVTRINWPQGEDLPYVEVLEAESFEQGLFEQVHRMAHLASIYNCPVIYEGNSQQEGVYRDTFLHLHPEVRLIRHYTTNTSKFDTQLGLTVVKTLGVCYRLHVAEDKLESEGIQTLVREIRDLAPPFSTHNHISAAIWFAIRHCYGLARHAGKTPKSGYEVVNPWRQQPSPKYFGGGLPAIKTVYGYGYGAARKETVLERERKKEEQRFLEQLRVRRAG